ncbi:MAG: tRNA (5-methylaminomethyl-2-thiouridine)(34)-methyltransferase MnmD [Crocinitomicaceae bacterium]|nr:tRNA (5-methylaminomethyl-2-thiouridine)(34)-methyltransferase MnmD [Crocinitomicaceae bacterium]
MERKIITTRDGSKTIHFPEINESYHSQHGALQEALHVFIKSGLSHYLTNNPEKSTLSILEVGWGTGLNAILTFDFMQQNFPDLKVNYYGLEAYPVSMEEIHALKYVELDTIKNHRQAYLAMHEAKWNEVASINSNFSLQKLKITIQDWQTITDTKPHVDLIYFDAFGPRVQPEMWTPAIFEFLFQLTKENGVFVTYCSKGQVRRDLIAAGFDMEKIAGPPGKREMLRGLKKIEP